MIHEHLQSRNRDGTEAWEGMSSTQRSQVSADT